MRSEKQSDRAPSEIDRVHAVRKCEVLSAARIPSVAAVAKLSVEAITRLLPRGSKTVRAKAAKGVMEYLIVSEKAAPTLIVVPNFLTWRRVVETFDVKSAVVSVTPIKRCFHCAIEGSYSAVHDLAF